MESEECNEKCHCSSCIRGHRSSTRWYARGRERGGDQGTRNDRPAKRDGGSGTAIREGKRRQGEDHIRPRRPFGKASAGRRGRGLTVRASGQYRRLDQGRQVGTGFGHYLARSGVGVAVRKGAPKPDISTPEA